MTEADVFDALASPVRRAILDLLREGPHPVRDLAAAFSLTRPAISQHLKVLRRAGLVTEERVGRERHYRLDARPLRAVVDWAGDYEPFWRRQAGAPREDHGGPDDAPASAPTPPGSAGARPTPAS